MSLSWLKLKLLCIAGIACLLIPSQNSAYGGVMLTLQEQGAVDLLNLSVGQSFNIDVVLSGLQPGEELNYLAGTVLFESSLLGSASNIAAGAIVPDLDGFIGFGTNGLADANYDVTFTLSGLTIVTNGVLYSFSVTAQQAGAGLIGIDIPSLAARDALDQFVAIDGGIDLHYSINSGPTVVPEPATWIVFCLLGFANHFKRRALFERWTKH